jgi:hypothetical protein
MYIESSLYRHKKMVNIKLKGDLLILPYNNKEISYENAKN